VNPEAYDNPGRESAAHGRVVQQSLSLLRFDGPSKVVGCRSVL
jgi:hypothetical protein